ncbi:MAG: hypothetical protein PHQ42_01585 [Patescibacteria group bacterium]|nr:hypothetical protein [Patescibacteria group bacterium]
MNQKVKTILLIFTIFLLTIIFSFILSPIGGSIYKDILNGHCGGGLFLLEMGDSNCQTEGFIYFYIFFLTIFSFILLRQKIAWYVFAIGSFIFWLLSLFMIFTENLDYQRNVYISDLIIMVCFFIFAWLLAQGGLIIYRKLKK